MKVLTVRFCASCTTAGYVRGRYTSIIPNFLPFFSTSVPHFYEGSDSSSPSLGRRSILALLAFTPRDQFRKMAVKSFKSIAKAPETAGKAFFTLDNYYKFIMDSKFVVSPPGE